MNHNKDIAIFMRTFRKQGLLKNKMFNKLVYLIKIESFDEAKIISLLKNTKYAVYVSSINDEKKSFFLTFVWLNENQRNSLFDFESSSFFKNSKNRISIFSFSEQKFSLPLLVFNYILLFKTKVQQIGHPGAKYIEKAFQVQDEYSDLFPIFKIESIPAFDYLINPKKKRSAVFRLNLSTGIFETVWISKGEQFIQEHDKF